MTPVCPACRAPIALGASICPRCGLAVRPTCSSCGEPLQYPASSCWYCRAQIAEPDAVEGSAPRVEAVPPVATSAPAALAVAPAVAPSGRAHVPARRVVVEGVVAAFLLTVAMLALEAFAPRYSSTSSRVGELERETFRELGFLVGVPSGWTVTTTRRAATFESGEQAGDVSTRGFRVSPLDVPFADVPQTSESTNLSRFASHDIVSTSETRLGRRDAYVRVLFVEGRRIEQWWIDLGRGRSLRVEFWSRGADDDAAQVNARILDTLEVL